MDIRGIMWSHNAFSIIIYEMKLIGNITFTYENPDHDGTSSLYYGIIVFKKPSNRSTLLQWHVWNRGNDNSSTVFK